MSKEAAAATLTQIYFASLQNERDRLSGRSPQESYAVTAVDEIGKVYSIILARMDLFDSWAKTRKP